MGTRNPPKQLSTGCVSLFGLPFLAAGLFLSWLYFSGYTRWWSARNWEEVPCWIEAADLKIDHGKGTTYKATASYRYEFAGRTYHGDRVSFHGGADNIGDFQHEAYRELSGHLGGKRSRQPFRCYVNPAEPSDSVLYRTLRWEMQAFMAIFALTFPAVGAGLVAGGLLGLGISKREASLKARNPTEPWKWKEDWAGTAIPESANRWNGALYAYTGWAGVVILPLLVAMANSDAFQQNRAASLVLVFPALWCVPAWFSLRRLRQKLAVGAVRFEPKSLPASPGGSLVGDVVMAKPLPMRLGAEVALVCEKRITRSTGDGNSTTTEKLWSHRETVAQDAITRDVSGFRLPVALALPPDAPDSGPGADASITHVWKLDLKVPGTAIHPVFEIPVFRNGAPLLPGAAAASVPSILDEAAADLPALLSARRIRAQFDDAGLPGSIVCPPARMLSLIVFLVLFDVVWTGAAVLLVKQHAPLIFRIVWPVSAAGIWLAVAWSILHQRSVTFHSTGVDVRNQLGPVIWTETFGKSDIVGFSSDTNMSSGNATYYRVRLASVLGKKKTLVDGITESNTAAALVKRLERWKNSN